MTNYFSLRLFLTCLLACALMALGVVWFKGDSLPPVYFQTTATLFIVGLASFLVWFSLTLLEVRTLLHREKSDIGTVRARLL